MARATVAEIDKRLSSHEAACEQRWKENYRRLEAIEHGITSLNKTLRNALIFVLNYIFRYYRIFISRNYLSSHLINYALTKRSIRSQRSRSYFK